MNDDINNMKADRPCDWCGAPGPYDLNHIYSLPDWSTAAMCDACKEKYVKDGVITTPPKRK